MVIKLLFGVVLMCNTCVNGAGEISDMDKKKLAQKEAAKYLESMNNVMNKVKDFRPIDEKNNQNDN